MTNENDAWVDELIAWAISLEEKYEIEDIIPHDKEALLSLMELDLSELELETIPESIGNLTNLTVLNLSNNDLSKIPKSIGNLTNLVELKLSGNCLRFKYELPNSVQGLIDCNGLNCWKENDEDYHEDWF